MADLLKIGFNPQDRFMMALGNTLVVVTQDGNVFGADVVGRQLQPVFQFSGAKIGFNPQDRFMMALGNTLVVVTQDGSVFGSDVVTFAERELAPVLQFSGAKIGFNPQDRFMMAVGNTLVVVTQDGSVFGSDVKSTPTGAAIGTTIDGRPIGTIFARELQPVFQFSGAKIGFNPQDRFMMALGNTLIVVTQDGNVFGANVVGRDVGPVFQVNHPMTGVVHVLVFTNFEGPISAFSGPIIRPEATQGAVDWLNSASKAHPEIRWTHLYTPYYLRLEDKDVVDAANVLSPFLLDLQASGQAEIGLHLHLWRAMVSAMGVEPLTAPSGEDNSPDCDKPDPSGYAVLLTGYSPEDRSAILDAAIESFENSGFGRPTTFCAGYSGADPDLQGMLADKGFTASFAAQPVSPTAPPPFNYSKCWHEFLGWSGHITPRTLPYRVNAHSILPPPHDNQDFLDLVEIPLNMWADAFPLFEGTQTVSKLDMFDCHYHWARDNNRETTVAIGVHVEIVAGETWGKGPISLHIDGFLNHVLKRGKEGGAKIVYSTASEVAERFRDNETIAEVRCGGPGARYAAVWELRGGPALQARHGLSAAQYQEAFDGLVGQGFRPVYVNGCTLGGQDLFAAIFEQSPGPPFDARHGLTADQYQQTFDEMSAKGFRPVCVSGYGSDGEDRYAAIWEMRDGPRLEARHGLTTEDYQTTFDDLVSQGFRLVHVNAHTNDGHDRFAALWEIRDGPSFRAVHNLNADQFQGIFDQLVAEGFRPVQVCGYGDGGGDRFAAIFEQRSDVEFDARHGLSDVAYQEKFNELAAQGFRPVCVSAY